MNKPTMRPTVGRIVHYQPHEVDDVPMDEPWAAIVTRVSMALGVGEVTEVADLCVLMPDAGMGFYRAVYYAEHPTPGHWNWPPRVSV